MKMTTIQVQETPGHRHSSNANVAEITRTLSKAAQQGTRIQALQRESRTTTRTQLRAWSLMNWCFLIGDITIWSIIEAKLTRGICSPTPYSLRIINCASMDPTSCNQWYTTHCGYLSWVSMINIIFIQAKLVISITTPTPKHAIIVNGARNGFHQVQDQLHHKLRTTEWGQNHM